MKKTILTSCAALALAMIASSASFGYTLLSPARRWFNADTPHQVNIDNHGISSIADSDHGVTAAVNAIKAWNSGGVNVTTSSSGNVAYRQGDGISDMIFGDPLNLCTGSCLAATLTGYYSTSTTGTCGGLTVDKITDSDTSFNLAYNWTSVAQGSCSNEIYVETVTTHECGHIIGLAHSSVASAIMFPTVNYCDNKPIGSDDINGRNALYNCTLVEGGGGGCSTSGQACTSNSQCCSNNCKGKGGSKTCR